MRPTAEVICDPPAAPTVSRTVPSGSTMMDGHIEDNGRLPVNK